ncbi:phosphatidylserine-specific receptor PtdSerR [Sphaerosporella brunnea]|uniref:Phosphatidylserine-specific receptor PtdSerR n=1 Tax=Sphaerosporella brunnea TaxID=1250544 RepID=A0A5J5ELP1_9PEZI|nr:phosphatidylserine-specific receptor PtdSerR [Sphaerosporella brunnea]
MHDDVNDASVEIEIQPHPLLIKPSGNAFTSESNLRDTSCGLFALFPDELILQVLGYLSEDELNAVGATSKGMYGFSRAEELWKSLFIESPACKEHFTWRGTWRRTVLNLSETSEARIALPNLFSDALYRPFHMSQVPLGPFVSRIPLQNQILRFSDMSAEEFNTKYSNTPFVLTSPVKDWPGFGEWTYKTLVSKYGDIKFRAESVDWRLRDYVAYMENQSDESPLYLFDRAFVEKTNSEMEAGFTVPDCFGKDFFEVLGSDRPDRRWMILGPERSGSTFHKDPNATSAWNAVVEGEKYWIMFPPDSPPPGVFVSEDQSEVTSPLSIAEWLVGFHKVARRIPGCVEGICKAGEILHVPSGWWHLVVNTQPSLALTQNFVPTTRLPAALEFLDKQRHSISGFNCERVKDPYALFVQRMEEQYPGELKKAMEALEAKYNRKTKWEMLVEDKKGSSGGFSFGFAGGDDSDDD